MLVDMRVIVRADNYAQFLDWCHLHRVNPRAARYVGPDEALVACHDDVVVDLRVAAITPNLGAFQASVAA
jgi:hypothetical protein